MIIRPKSLFCQTEESAPGRAPPQEAVEQVRFGQTIRLHGDAGRVTLYVISVRILCPSPAWTMRIAGRFPSFGAQSKIECQVCDVADDSIRAEVVAEHDDRNSGAGYHDKVGLVADVSSAMADRLVPCVLG